MVLQDAEESSMARNNRIYQKSKEVTAFGIMDYSNLKVVVLGDSVGAGVGNRIEDGGDGRSWPDMLSDKLGFRELVNLSVPGMMISDESSPNIYEQLSSIPEDADIIILALGYNDYFYEASRIGNLLRFSECCKDVFSHLRENCPKADIFLVIDYNSPMSDSYSDWAQYPVDNICYEDVVVLLRKYTERYGITVFDMYAEGYLDGTNLATERGVYYDKIHLNRMGYEMYAQYIEAKLTEYYSLERLLTVNWDAE